MNGRNKILLLGLGVGVIASVIHFLGDSPRASIGDTNPKEPLPSVARPAEPYATEPDVPALAARLLAADPTDENGRFASLLDELCRTGQFDFALALARTAAPALQADCVKIVFSRWAQSRPQEAARSLETLADPQLHSAALRALADGWNTFAPDSLAAFAYSLPSGDDRNYALGRALDNWSLQDPVALAAWLNTLPRGYEYDYGVAVMIQKSDTANRPPELAMQWVENIGDPELRQNAFDHVIAEWMQTDAIAARKYLARSGGVSGESSAENNGAAAAEPPAAGN